MLYFKPLSTFSAKFILKQVQKDSYFVLKEEEWRVKFKKRLFPFERILLKLKKNAICTLPNILLSYAKSKIWIQS